MLKRRAGIVLSFAAFLCALGAVAAASVDAAKRLPLIGHEGRWLTDPQGRVVIVHGLQQFGGARELAGPLPHGEPLPADLGFGADDARFLAAHGFNAMRLSLSYWEHAPGRFDRGYLKGFRRFARVLARAGAHSLVEFHQGIYGPRFFQGHGFPEWMTYTDGYPIVDAGWPNSYLVNPAMNRAWDNLWVNRTAPDGVGLQDHLAAGWRFLARRFAREAGVLGYDLINEPWPGSTWPACANPTGCPPGGVEETGIAPMYDRVAAAIREVDRRHLIVYEPNLLFGYGADTRLPGLDDPRAVLGFHNYCLDSFYLPDLPGSQEGCKIDEEVVFDNADAFAEQTGDGLLLGEWGGPYSLADMERMLEGADEHLVGWMYWDYLGVVPDPTKPPSNANRKLARLRLLERPYPQRTAGTPERIAFDDASGVFETRFSTTLPSGRPAGRKLTRIYLPALHYPRGYSVDVAGATIVSRRHSCLLRLRARRGAAQVEVMVTRRDDARTRCRPARAAVHARRHGEQARFRWRALGGDLPTWGYDVQIKRKSGWRTELDETHATTVKRRLPERGALTVRVRAVDVAGSVGRWNLGRIPGRAGHR